MMLRPHLSPPFTKLPRLLASALVVGSFVVGSPARACEPIVPLLYVHGGHLAAFGRLGIAGLCTAVVFKSLVFAGFSRDLGRIRAFLFMVLANVGTTIAGILAVAVYAVPQPVGLLVSGLVLAISISPADRFAATCLPARLRGKGLPLLVVFVSWLGCLFLLGLSRVLLARYELDPLEARGALAGYWIAKYGFVFFGVALGMAFTTVWEEWLVAKMAGSARAEVHHYPAAVRANLATFLVGWIGAAALALPARLGAPDFLAMLRGVLGP